MSLSALKKCFFTLGLVIIVAVLCKSATAADLDNDGLDDATESSLAEMFAPILQFEENEEVFPVSVDYLLSRANLNQSTDDTSLFITSNPSPVELAGYTNPESNHYLDNRRGTIDDDTIITDSRNYTELNGYTVYTHVFPNGEDTIVQYWLFYAFNKGPLNTHEGDWEMIQVVVGSDGEPNEAMYSQHLSGQRAAWGQVITNDDHPIVYVARGSHANYFRSYQGLLGLASDQVGKNGKELKPEEYVLVNLGEQYDGNHPADQDWLDFAGRWGDFGTAEAELRGKRGPFGPSFREDGSMWAGVSWGESLPELSSTMLYFDWIVYHFVYIFFAVLGLSIAAAAFIIYRRHKKTGLTIPYSSLFRVYKPNVNSIANILAVAGIVIAAISLFYPWYAIEVDINDGPYQTTDAVDVLTIDGRDGLQVNLLEENSGMVQIGAVPIAFSLIVGAGILLFILRTIGANERQAGRKYISRGIHFWIPVILIIVAVVVLKSLIFQIANTGASDAAVDEIKDILGTVARQPWGGQTTASYPSFGTTDLHWGLGLGAYLLIAAGILLVAGGALSIWSGKKDHSTS